MDDILIGLPDDMMMMITMVMMIIDFFFSLAVQIASGAEPLACPNDQHLRHMMLFSGKVKCSRACLMGCIMLLFCLHSE